MLNPTLSFPTLMCILAVTTHLSTSESSSNTTTFNSLTEKFQNLLLHSQSTKNEYLKFVSSIEKFEHQNLSNEEEKVLIFMSAAAVAKVLSELDKPFREDVLEIRSKIRTLEQLKLKQYISSESSRLESEIASKIRTTDNNNTDLVNQITHLKSMFQLAQNNNNISSANIDSLITSKSQVLTLTLVQIYVCTANPVRKFHDIQRVFHQVNSTLEIDRWRTLELSPKCLDLLTEFHTSLTSAGHNLITFSHHPHETETIRVPLNSLNNSRISSSRTINQEQLMDFVTAAAQFESSVNDLIKNQSALAPQHLPELRNLYFLASVCELSDPTCLSQHAQNADMEKIGPPLQILRNLRQRLYSALKSSLSPISRETAKIIRSDYDEHIVTDTLSGIIDNLKSKCTSKFEEQMTFINPKPFETQLSKLNYFKYISKLSNLISYLNTTHASEGNFKTLVTLCKQTVKTSLLQIEYNQMIKKQTDMVSPPDPITTHSSRVKSYTFTMTESKSCSPDNYVQPCYLINEQFPGPPIIVNQHDILRVTVINRLSVAITIHFHGILQKHTVSSDGVAHVTQDAILPNQTYVYEMLIGEQSGTYMYHGHVGLDLVWLHGALIVRDNPEEWKSLGSQYAYDHEHTFLLEEVFHKSFDQLIKEMMEEGVDDPPVDSFAINGKSHGEWETNQGNSSSGYSTLTVTPGKTYRIRVINNAAGSMLVFTIQNHTMTVIEMDGIITEPVSTDRLELHTGQRYSVLVKMDRKVANYWVQARLMGEDGGADNGRAILHYDCGGDFDEMKTRLFPYPSAPVEITGNGWILDQLMPNAKFHQKGVYDFPTKSDKQILIDMQMRTVDGPPRYLVNGKLFQKPKRPYLESVRNGEGLGNETHVFPIKEGEVIDLVFQNRVDDTGGCDEHPIHLHGHSFWVAASGADEVNMNTIETQLALESGNRREFRDTFTLFPNSTEESKKSGAPCGWAVVRFLANNPGTWYVHCHVTSHMILGKMFVLYEYNENNMKLVNE